MSSGKKANNRGEAFRDEIALLLVKMGKLSHESPKSRGDAALCEFLDQARLSININGGSHKGLLARDVSLFRGIYGNPFNLDFLIWRKGWSRPLALCCKCQESSGSVIEKFPYLFENLRCSPVPSCLVLAGDGIFDHAGAMQYIARQTSRGDSVKHVFKGIDKLRLWIVEGMREFVDETASLFSS